MNKASQTTITLRINSYQNGTIFLKDGKILFNANMTQNYKDNSPIISTASRIMESLRGELHQNVSLYVTGNPFEQALMALKCEQNKSFVDGYASGAPTVVFSTQERLAFLEELGCTGNRKIAVSVDCKVSAVDIHLPTYPLVELVPGDMTHKIVVSDNLNVIRGELDFGVEECAFYIGGQSEEYEGQYIIGCTADNVNELVQAYLETKHINPLVGELFQQVSRIISVEQHPKSALLNRTEPFYYSTRPSDQPIKMYDDRAYPLPVRYITIDENGHVIIGYPLSSQIVRRYRLPNGTYLNDTAENAMEITGLKPGEYDLCVCFEDSAPFVEFHIVVEEAIYVRNIDICIPNDDKNVLQVGKTYNVNLTIEPQDALDSNRVTLVCDNPEVAELDGDKIQIKKEGAFTLLAKATKSYSEAKATYKAHVYGVEEIWVEDWPLDTLPPGRVVNPTVKISPRQANKSGFSYSIIQGKNKIEDYPEMRSGASIYLKTRKPGTVRVRFTSRDNPEVYCDRTLKIKKDEYEPWSFLFIMGILVSICAIVLFALSKTVLACLGMIGAVVLFVRSLIQDGRFVKNVIAVVLAILLTVCFIIQDTYLTNKHNAALENDDDGVSDISDTDTGSIALNDFYFHYPFAEKG